MDMRNIGGNTATVLLSLLLLCLLSACGGETPEPALSDVVTRIDEAFGNAGGMMTVDADFIRGSLRMTPDAYAEACVKINAFGANVDEYGVFKGADAAAAKEIKQAVEAYLQLRVDTWMEAYMPAEKPKVTSAQLVTQGNYVCYAILDEAEKTAVFEAFEACFR